MSGLDPDLMHRALDNLSQRVVDRRRLAPGDVLEGVLGGAPVALATASAYALDELQPPAWRAAFTPTGALEADPVWDFPVPPDTRAFTCRHVLEEGRPLLLVARESDTTRSEDWTLHCGSPDHETDDAVVVHLAHVVRGAPSVRALADLPLDWEADRDDVDSDWRTRALGS